MRLINPDLEIPVSLDSALDDEITDTISELAIKPEVLKRLLGFGEMSVFASEAIVAYRAALAENERSRTELAAKRLEINSMSFENERQLSDSFDSPEFRRLAATLTSFESDMRDIIISLPKAQLNSRKVLEEMFMRKPENLIVLLEAIDLDTAGFSDEIKDIFREVIAGYFASKDSPKLNQNILSTKKFEPYTDDFTKKPHVRIVENYSYTVKGVGLPAAQKKTLKEWIEALFLTMNEAQVSPSKDSAPLITKGAADVEDLSKKRAVIAAVIDRLFLGQNAEIDVTKPQDVWTAMLRSRETSKLVKPQEQAIDLVDFEGLSVVQPDLGDAPILQRNLDIHAKKAALESGKVEIDPVIRCLLGSSAVTNIIIEMNYLAHFVLEVRSNISWLYYIIAGPKGRKGMTEAQRILTTDVEPVAEQFYEGFKMVIFFRHLGEKLANATSSNPDFTEQALYYLALARGISKELARQVPMIEVALDMRIFGEGFNLSAITDGVAALEVLRSDPAANDVRSIIQDVVLRVQAASEVVRLESRD